LEKGAKVKELNRMASAPHLWGGEGDDKIGRGRLDNKRGKKELDKKSAWPRVLEH